MTRAYVKTVDSFECLEDVENNVVDGSVAVDTSDCYDLEIWIVLLLIYSRDDGSSVVRAGIGIDDHISWV